MPDPTQHIAFRPKEDQNKWNAVFSVFFFAVLVGALAYMYHVYHGLPLRVEPFDVLLMSLATFRLTRLMVYDKITRWVRELFVKRTLVEQDGVMWVKLTPHRYGAFRTIHELFGCPWCISVWAALIVVFSYYVFTWGFIMMLILAISGIGSLFQIIANLVGWKAELLKEEVRER